MKNLLDPEEFRREIFVYVVGTLLIILGGIYALWRIRMLDAYLTGSRAYVMERDARWEAIIKGAVEDRKEILRRLPPR